MNDTFVIVIINPITDKSEVYREKFHSLNTVFRCLRNARSKWEVAGDMLPNDVHDFEVTVEKVYY